MTDSSISEVAQNLVNARRSHTPWDARNTPALTSVEESYAIQEQVTDLLGAQIGGWKTAAPDTQATPVIAPIFSDAIYQSGAIIPASTFFMIGIEGEIAFRMNADFPLRDRPYDHQDIEANIAEVLPVMELVDTRMLNGTEETRPLFLADNQGNGGLVTGTGFSNWQDIDISAQLATVTVNGVEEFSGINANPAGELVDLLTRAINLCTSRKRPVKSGDIIITGSCTGVLFVQPGAEVVVNFPKIGQVRATFPE